MPKKWSSHNDTTTLNVNFKQITKMINKVVLARVDAVEQQLNERLSVMDKQVGVLHNLFTALNEQRGSPSSSAQLSSPASETSLSSSTETLTTSASAVSSERNEGSKSFFKHEAEARTKVYVENGSEDTSAAQQPGKDPTSDNESSRNEETTGVGSVTRKGNVLSKGKKSKSKGEVKIVSYHANSSAAAGKAAYKRSLQEKERSDENVVSNCK